MLITAFPAMGHAIYPFLPSNTDTNKVKVSDNAIKSKVHYSAKDSIRLDLQNKKIFLYGDAVVDFENTTIQAEYLEVNFVTHIISAEGRMDSARHLIGKPVVKEGDKSFTAKKIYGNYETKKFKIYEIITQEGDGKVQGVAVKKDSSNVYYIQDGRYSTCILDEPHFDIHAKKLKIIPNDKIITGPAQLEVMGIPTPLAVPFGFFPNKKGRASGIIIPAYGESQNLGFFLKEGGYYFGINDKVDLALKGDIYSRGSWGAKAISNYKVRYKYNGNFNVSYARTLIENSDYSISQNNYFVRWTHSQDPKSNPSTRFSANVNAGTSNYNSLNAYRPADYLSNTFQSNIAWTKSFIGTPFNLSANLRHNQNTITKQVDLSIPDVTLSMNRIYPFKSQNAIGEKWFHKIGVNATMNASNRISSADSLLFKASTLNRMRNGVNTIIPISASLRSHLKTKSRIINSLNYFSLTPAMTITDNLYIKTIQKRYNASRDSIMTDTVSGAKNSFDYSLSATLTTKLYGTYTYKHFLIKQIHHVMTPAVALVYRPDFSENKYGYYRNVQTNALGYTQPYSIFQNGIYGGAPQGEQKMVTMSLANNLEAKLRPRGDTSTLEKKVSIIDNFNINTAFNAAAAHFQWSPIFMSAQTAFFNRRLNVNCGATIDPYMMDTSGTRIEKFEINHNSRIGRITNSYISFGTSIRSKDKNVGQPKTSSKGSVQELEHINLSPNSYIDFNVRWTLMLNYDLRYDKIGLTSNITQTMRFSGDINLTQKWKVGFNSGYDLRKSEFTYTSVNVYRDLHCWEMAFNWIPFGIRQSYSIDLKVKSAVLQDLKLSRKRDWYDYAY